MHPGSRIAGGKEMKRMIGLILLSVLLAAPSALSLAADQKTKKPANKVWDSGTFGIYVNGKRIGAEKFQIEQRGEVNVVTSEIKVDDGNNKAVQTAEMQVTPKGELRSYVWRATSPQKEEASVEPKDQLLVEHVVPADQKKVDVPHILPTNTIILDDNFFSQREILVLRYLATGCEKQGQGLVCPQSRFGTLVPHQHAAGEATISLLGQERIVVKGQSMDVNKLKLDADGVSWMLWVSDDYKILKMSVPATNVEVVRE
jgi:hypothetical protein